MLSIVLLLLLGAVGEEVLDLPVLRGIDGAAECMPAITRFFLWLVFVGVWLLAVGYLTLFGLALLQLFHVSLVGLGDSRVPKAVWTINTVAIVVLVAVWVSRGMKRKKTDASLPADG